MSVLNNLKADLAVAAAKNAAAAAPAKADRKVSDFWLNIGIWIADADGAPLFVSLPTGIALDDMKPTPVKGTNQAWIDLAQTKNGVLEFLQTNAASMKPGERQSLSEPVIGEFGVEIYRRNDPAQHAVAGDNSNPLMTSLMSALSKAA